MGGLVLDKTMIGKPKVTPWVAYIHERIKKNKNFIGFISGQTGSGKSWASLSIAEQIDPKFNIERVVFNGLELMELINSDKLKKGSVVVFEESGVEMNNRNWQSVTNKMLNFLMQTFRHRNFILIMNSPYMDFVDASTRKLFHAEFKTEGINMKEKKTLLKPLLMQYNSRNQKFYYKYLKQITDKGIIRIEGWDVIRPSKELVNAYEKKKREFTDKLNRNIMDELLAEKYKKEKKNKNHLTDNQKEVLQLLREGHNIDEIAEIRDRASNTIRSGIELIKKKGYDIKPVYEGNKVIKYLVTEQ